MDINNVRSHGGIKHMSKTKRLFWIVMIIVDIVFVVALGLAIDKANKNTMAYNYAIAKPQMFCIYDDSEITFESVKNYPNGDYEIHGICPICKIQWTLTYDSHNNELKKFIGE